DPTAVPVSTLLTSAERSIGISQTLGGGLSAGLSVYMHQQATREAPDQYNMTGGNARIENPWYAMYGAIKNLDVIIEQGTTESRFKYVGIAKILKAYTYSIMVDVWGDIPFSEFNKFKAGIFQPKFDDDATIYPQLFAMIDAGIADINNTAANASVPAGDDIIYKGNTALWVKAANTIKLKMYTQVRKVQNVTPQVTALLAAPATLINANSEMFVMPFGPLAATDDRHPGFSDYTSSQRGQLPSPWLYEIMKGYPNLLGSYPNLLSGLTDPRLPYYIFNQNAKGFAGSAANQTEYRDIEFISIIFGSIGPNRNGAQQNFQSLFGIYPVGGRYYDSTTHVASSASGTGAAPQRLITYADRLYLEAELINTGTVATGVERTVFQNAVTASFSQVDYVITTYVKPTQTVPVLATQAATTTYITGVMAKYDAAATATRRLEYIITEKWLSSVGSSVDQYTDYRRTGYPILFDPRNTAMAPGGFVQPPVNGNPVKIPQEKVPVQRLQEFPLSLQWPLSELELNANAPTQKTLPVVYKVFWMP
ncbi:MAG TPA: SusD/RagB family nutrient-binding outer membrane lipoprotein, partial [Ferruginibacter sp.]|nr:SusD/RagB family nutrient-binding outer membrane lipoprotein [Ferruginibacter sp.]